MSTFVEETPEQAAESISDALDFLRREADAAGLSDVSDLLQQASAKSRQHSAALLSAAVNTGQGETEPVDRNQDPTIVSIRPWRRRYLPLAVAAGAAAVAFAFLLLPAQVYQASYQTAIGQHQEIRLPDDSILSLNTNSEVTVFYSDTERRVNLKSGEAHFDVTPAPGRPFSVAAGSGTVRAVGTEFNVYLKNDVVEVMVAEGIVEVEIVEVQANASQAATAAETLSAGQTLQYRDTIESVSTVDQLEIARKLAWQDGMLDFQGQTLAEVVEEAGRYISTRITITDSEVKGLGVRGYIRAGDVGTLLELIESNELVAVHRIDPHHVQITAAPALNRQ